MHELLDGLRARRLRAKDEGGHEVGPVGDTNDEGECQPRVDDESGRRGGEAPLSEVLAQEGLVELQEAVAEGGIPVASEAVHLSRDRGVYRYDVRASRWYDGSLDARRRKHIVYR